MERAVSGRGRLGREGTRPGALFREGGVAAPGPAALATGGLRSGAGGEWPFAPTADSSVTVCDREVGDDRDPSEKGLPTSQKAPFMTAEDVVEAEVTAILHSLVSAMHPLVPISSLLGNVPAAHNEAGPAYSETPPAFH
ncbi:hypothetical protein J1605_021146 [Eschrichtius robustus]|uniref:Uncharacterized protein n=1 Tax=Eschrichtius robustus TaxID=9764 RepID=A0AB34HF52_ESCRO|nr:hypothetical protein J1605_021146 [Eschrichtius robustus]